MKLHFEKIKSEGTCLHRLEEELVMRRREELRYVTEGILQEAGTGHHQLPETEIYLDTILNLVHLGESICPFQTCPGHQGAL